MKRILAIALFLPLLAWAPTQLLQRKGPAFVIGGGYFDGLVTTNGLISYWRMDESSTGVGAVTRADSWSGYDLTDNNTTASAAGVIANAADFELDNTEYLSRADNADLSLGTNVSFSLTGWFKLETKPASSSCIISKDDGVSGNREYYILYVTGTDRIQFAVGRAAATTVDACNSTNFTGFSTNVWYFVAATFDPSINTMSISVNAGTADVNGGKSIDPPNSATAVNVGRRAAADLYFDGLIDELSFWKNRVLSATDISNLYNAGAGRDL